MHVTVGTTGRLVSRSTAVGLSTLLAGTVALAAAGPAHAAAPAGTASAAGATVTAGPTAPTVTSPDYPADEGWYGGPGVPGSFTFDAGGDTDVLGFRYWLDGGAATQVAADQPGGSATVTVTPGEEGPAVLSVQAVDAAGNRSPATSHTFRVRDTSPTITDGNSTAGYGQPRTLTLTPGMPGVVAYTYRLDAGAEQTVVAAPDGTATITLAPTTPGWNNLYVRSRTADDLPSGERWHRFHLETRPTISSVEYPLGQVGAPVGTPGTFVFQPGMPGVTEYVYRFGLLGPLRTVPAGPDGSASVTFTPPNFLPQQVTVFTRTADGIASESVTGHVQASRAS
ncbi:hypothetical protein [Micromonospora fluostatini]|uniref:hypothetical protein n=1 Tax=Micromonospora sp. JCM 30529 TaxID=3421643 RepID=UPI003D184BF2